MKKVFISGLVLLVLSSCSGEEKKVESHKSTGVDVTSIIKGYKGSLSEADKSYAYGQQLRRQVNSQARGRVIENQFINSYVSSKGNKDIDINAVSQKLYTLTQAKGPQAAGSVEELSKYLGIYFGFNESSNLYLSNLDVVSFAEGFKDVQMGKNRLGSANIDSLFTAEKENFFKQIGVSFLVENQKIEGVKVTESGLQYQVLNAGNEERPNENSEVTVHYEGTLITGDVFDSSYQRGEPISFNLQGVIKGWTEGLQLMGTGAKYRFYIPQELAYGSRSQAKIPGYSTLIFDVELISFQ